MITKTFLHAATLDLKFGLRTLIRNAPFSALVVLTMGLGIGANTAMFSVVRAVLLKPLTYQEPERLMLVTEGATPVRAREISAGSRSYTAVGSYAGGLENLALSGDREPEVLKGARVSANFLRIVGVSPLKGRGFLAEEDRPGAAPVAMISAELWRLRFGRNPAIVGKMATLAGTPTTIVGVLPPGFQFPIARADVWLPRPSEWSVFQPKSRDVSPFLCVFGRLRPGVDIQQATAELAVLNQQYASAHPGMLDSKPDSPEVVRPLREELISDVRPKLWMLFGAVGFVLLIVCANVGSLLLARAAARNREFAVRAAIGAGRGQIIGQLLAESIMLAILGGVLGIALAAVSLSAIRSMTFVDLPRAEEIHMDGFVLGFGFVLTLLTGVLLGLVPSLAASKPNLAGILRGGGEGTAVVRSKPVMAFGSRGLLVVGQVALSIVLLIGATLLIESLGHLYRVDPGFQVDRLLTMKIALPSARYDTDEKMASFYGQLIERSEALPGVRGAAMATTLPMGAEWFGTTMAVSGRPLVELNRRPIAVLESITPGYFRTMQIALKRGRNFTAQDNLKSAPVMIINESAARIFWPEYPGGPDPIGQRILIGNEVTPAEIVGIAADIHQTGKDMDPRPGLYWPSNQKPPKSAWLAVRTSGDPLSFASMIREQVLAIDHDQPVSEISTMDDIVAASEGQLQLITRLLGTFAGVATLLTMLGLYGVISYSVVQRTKEIGIRRALGAPRGNIFALIGRQVLILTLGGVVLGVGGAFPVTRLLRDLLFQVSTTDAVTFAGISLLFVLVALAASYVPARRAASVDPIEALRIG